MDESKCAIHAFKDWSTWSKLFKRRENRSLELDLNLFERIFPRFLWRARNRERISRVDQISSFVYLKKKKKICSRIILKKGLYESVYTWYTFFPSGFEGRREEERALFCGVAHRWKEGLHVRRERGRTKTGDVKCRARTPARNCSLRFSREDLRLRDLLDLRGKAKASRKPR